ncbi:MAG: AAA family ATPase [Erysipelotrichaceae bacterium]|nr:AAA family ATPase [Erysipelotrichaceae bacterium]MDY5251255.1 AAA family ATPase [Erysipelotrichaceae bacterium]
MNKKSKTTLEKERLMKEVLGKRRINDFNFKTFEEEIKQDYGLSYPKELQDDKQPFTQALSQLKLKVMGQDEALNELVTAFRRPYVMGYQYHKNAMIVYGNEGVGKHTAIQELAKLLSKDDIVNSYEVYTLDMGLYQSATQESLFLQDLFSAINHPSSIICFENCKATNRIFLQMLSELIQKGKLTLNKRYVNQKGQLIESQSGLVKEAVSFIKAQDKYLVFLCDDQYADVEAVFDQAMLASIRDKIHFTKLNDATISKLITSQLHKIQQKVQDKLGIALTIDESIEKWLYAHYDHDRQMTCITSYLAQFYANIAQYALEHEVKEMTLKVEKIPLLIADDKQHVSLLKEDTKESLQSVKAQLADIVGLEKVKQHLWALESHILIQQKRKEQGLKTSPISKHMIFTGNPGTGKTTIARLLSRYMLAINALSKGQLVEVTRSDLVGKYVGHTAPLTMKVVESALGGVLFIDEAYSLYRGKDDSYGLECIDTLVKAIEDHRDELIVILAGYDKEMTSFLEANSGLRSRFPNIIHFDDYTAEQLLAIAQNIAQKQDYQIDEQALPALLAYFTQKQADRSQASGNGRLARNIVESAILQQAKRLATNPEEKLTLLKIEDFRLEE